MQINAGTLQSYLTATIENAQDHAEQPPQLMFMIERMDQIFREEIFVSEYDAHPVSALLVMNAHMMLMSSIRQALSGHVVSTFPIVRAALESACYAFLICQDEQRAEVWLERHESVKALKACRNIFQVSVAVKELRPLAPEMAEYVSAHYDAAIDYGAHPNKRSVMNHFEDGGANNNGLHSFHLVGVYGRNSWQVNHALLVCVEVGQAIAFLVAASASDHTFVRRKVSVFQEWMDEKNRIVEELNGGPLAYANAMYTSIDPPL